MMIDTLVPTPVTNLFLHVHIDLQLLLKVECKSYEFSSCKEGL